MKSENYQELLEEYLEGDPVAEVLDAVELLRRGPPDHAMDVVALLEQQLGKV